VDSQWPLYPVLAMRRKFCGYTVPMTRLLTLARSRVLAGRSSYTQDPAGLREVFGRAYVCSFGHEYPLYARRLLQGI
jgi:hypothetical protein